jgi:hypothetical protein
MTDSGADRAELKAARGAGGVSIERIDRVLFTGIERTDYRSPPVLNFWSKGRTWRFTLKDWSEIALIVRELSRFSTPPEDS